MITPSSIGLPPKFTSFRREVKQEETILSLASSPSPISILQASCGVGKSIIAPSVGLLRGDRILYLTKSKSLQRQLFHDFEPIGLVDISGHSNYPCADVKFDSSGEMADLICQGRRKQNGQTCFYDEKAQSALQSHFVSTNYAHWVQLSRSGDPDRLGKFDLLICDEAHNIASGSCILGDLVSIKFFASNLDMTLGARLPRSTAQFSISDWIDWAREMIDLAAIRKQNLSQGRAIDPRDYLTLTRLISDLDRLISESPAADFVILPIRNPRNGSTSGFQFKPANIAHYTQTYLFRGISSVLLCSGSIFREDSKLLGIDENDLTYHEVSSTFSYRRRPFIYFPTSPPIKCDRSMEEGEKKLWISQLDTIMKVEPGKGIIQSRSYDRAEEILNRSSLKSQILIYDRNNAQEIIEQFKESSSPCTLIGPTIEEGEDFPGDLCSYVIWPKVPFLNHKDPFIARMIERDKQYSNREVCRSIIQGSLRGMRSAKDWCRIWMVDKHWGHFRLQPHFYKWFRMAFTMIRDVREAPTKPEERKG